MEVEFRKHLPPYRSLVDPKAQYDYRTHSFVQFSQSDLSKILSGYQLPKMPRATFKMKYKSLLSDVSMRASLLSRKVPSVSAKSSPPRKRPAPTSTSFNDLPEEVQIRIFSFVNDTPSYQNCLYTSKTFYRMAKPFLFRYVSFTSTYRFAQFITYLRLNSALGMHVLEVDLSQLKPGSWELEAQSDDDQEDNESDMFQDILAIWAGWRDWKFANNPLYTLHPLPATPLTKAISPHSPGAIPSHKKRKFSSYFKKRRRSHTRIEHADDQKPHPGPSRNIQWLLQHSSHPKINKFLMNYSSSKDLPIGYIIHLINMCPNLRSVNFGNLSLSTDYLITPKMSQKYQGFDIMNNFSKETMETIDSLYPVADADLLFPNDTMRKSPHDLTSSASSVFSLSTLSKPIRKYNSLLPPLPKSVRDISYLSKGDGLVFLSDLNLKSINSAHLETINEAEILSSMCKRTKSLENINLSSMIWINLRLVKQFIGDMLASDLRRKKVEGKECTVFKNNYFSPLEPLDEEDDDEEEEEEEDAGSSKSMVLDLSNSGMNKNLRWAQPIDLKTRKGRKLVHKILNDELLPSFEEYMLRERDRMGRPGENYFA
ncbi:hypothetical protein FT663_02184 [Candidozyma haemuli var. vulneris]|uniref:F-box domain-containing protein n=1 Tax=Candidozyma haemuli TaxID=45357 RepID=A0A2V1AW95_9ASCO|nr:hypothetical protein CXQ85_004728 [[Candida] haemuloni]KAF3990173.1 hypothetical protein FT662_02383 [[Candida] haemuloni var. vulneris]KAF3992671.1 hypothetical protein FT663_02184 [[Candida] haemuloni var. vulneris]PVH22059.1 hypothetical protein CXQ85_004728 [[Candida] haemuloni]